MQKRWIATLGITACFVGLYALLRSLPSEQCSALHYQVTRETANGVEMCSSGPVGLIDLERVRFPGALLLHTAATGTTGDVYQGSMTLTGPKGEPLLPHEIAITHAAKIHMMIVHESLEDYHHLHPQPIVGSSKWTFTFTPRLPGNYHIYTECVPLRTQKQLIVNETLKIEGQTVEIADSAHPFEPSIPDIRWTFRDTAPEAGSRTDFAVAVAQKDGEPIPLEKFMDAYCHVVAFRRGSVGYAHIHPLSTEPPADPRHPEFEFTFYTGDSGQYRLWAQFQIDGQSIFIPYNIDVR